MNNYFELFGLPVTFTVDQPLLRKKYLENSRKFHPDLAADDQSELSAEELSSANNEGFRVLTNFYETVAYILVLKGKMNAGEKEKLDPAFLGEMMDINEGLMELEMEFDSEVFEKLKHEAENRLESIENSLRQLAQQYDTEKNDNTLDRIKEDYLKRKYLLRIRDSIDKFAAPLS